MFRFIPILSSLFSCIFIIVLTLIITRKPPFLLSLFVVLFSNLILKSDFSIHHPNKNREYIINYPKMLPSVKQIIYNQLFYRYIKQDLEKIFLPKILHLFLWCTERKNKIFLQRICTQLFSFTRKREEDDLTWSLNQQLMEIQQSFMSLIQHRNLLLFPLFQVVTEV